MTKSEPNLAININVLRQMMRGAVNKIKCKTKWNLSATFTIEELVKELALRLMEERGLSMKGALV